MFIFKNKEISIDCFTCKDSVNKYTPIDYSHKFIPDWWKDIPPFKLSPFKFLKSQDQMNLQELEDKRNWLMKCLERGRLV